MMRRVRFEYALAALAASIAAAFALLDGAERSDVPRVRAPHAFGEVAPRPAADPADGRPRPEEGPPR